MHFNAPVLLRSSITVILTVVGLAGCSRQEQGPEPLVLARIGDVVITEADFKLKLQAEQVRSPAAVDAGALLQELVDREILVQNAKKAGLESDQEVQDLIKDVLIAKFKERKLADAQEKVTVSDEELKNAYEVGKQQFMKPESLKLAMLHLTVASDQEKEETHTRLESAAEQAKRGGSAEGGFGALSVACSDDQESRYRGGDIGWVELERHPARIDPAAIKAAFELKAPGDVSSVITGKSGLYVMKLLERRSSAESPLEQVAPILKQRLLQQKKDQLADAFQSELRSGLQVEVHPDRVKAFNVAVRETLPPSPAIQ